MLRVSTNCVKWRTRAGPGPQKHHWSLRIKCLSLWPCWITFSSQVKVTLTQEEVCSLLDGSLFICRTCHVASKAQERAAKIRRERPGEAEERRRQRWRKQMKDEEKSRERDRDDKNMGKNLSQMGAQIVYTKKNVLSKVVVVVFLSEDPDLCGYQAGQIYQEVTVWWSAVFEPLRVRSCTSPEVQTKWKQIKACMQRSTRVAVEYIKHGFNAVSFTNIKVKWVAVTIHNPESEN